MLTAEKLLRKIETKKRALKKEISEYKKQLYKT